MDVGTKLRFQRCWQNLIKLVCCLSNNWNCGISILQWRLVLQNTAFYLQLKYNSGNNNVNYTQNGHNFNVKHLKLHTLNAASLMLTRVSLLTLSYSPLSRMKFWRLPDASESIPTNMLRWHNIVQMWKHVLQVAWSRSSISLSSLLIGGYMKPYLFQTKWCVDYLHQEISLKNDFCFPFLAAATTTKYHYKCTLKLNRIVFKNKGFRLNWKYRFHIIQLSWVQMILHGNC